MPGYLDERDQLAWAGDRADRAELIDRGFVCHGEPSMPPHHWAHLIAELTDHELRTKKSLYR